MTVNQYLNLLIAQYFSIMADLVFFCFSFLLSLSRRKNNGYGNYIDLYCTMYFKQRPWTWFSFLQSFPMHGSYKNPAMFFISFIIFLCSKSTCTFRMNFGYSIYGHTKKALRQKQDSRLQNSIGSPIMLFFYYNNAFTWMGIKTRTHIDCFKVYINLNIETKYDALKDWSEKDIQMKNERWERERGYFNWCSCVGNFSWLANLSGENIWKGERRWIDSKRREEIK